jgi:hypothetical protein
MTRQLLKNLLIIRSQKQNSAFKLASDPFAGRGDVADSHGNK